jgi:8-oxo-dGTP diphosphatase
MQSIVNALFVKDRAVLLARRSAWRTNYPDRWSFPGGHVEHGESLEEALIRELQEEVGVRPLAFREIGALVEPTPRINGNVVYHFFKVTEWSGGEPRILGDEHVAIRWFSIDAACAVPDLALREYAAILHKLVQP